MRIFCVGRNYRDHARELNNAIPDKPVIFLKPESALIPPGGTVPYPAFSLDLHYETELVLRISGNGKNMEADQADTLWDGLGLGLDFTARDIQNELKTKGLPWELAKSFDGSAVVSPFLSRDQFPNPEDIRFGLQVNGIQKQEGNSRDMIFPFGVLLSFLSRYFELRPGDMVFTGTPAGVGPVKPGDLLEGFLEGEKVFETAVS